MDDCTLQAVDSMGEVFYALLRGASGFEDFEGGAMDACMGVCAEATVCALERADRSFLDARHPVGARVHDIRERTLLCECGQVTFRRRRFELADGTRFFALDDALSLRAGSRSGPGAFSMALDDALSGAYARADELLCRHTRTQLSRRARRPRGATRRAGRTPRPWSPAPAKRRSLAGEEGALAPRGALRRRLGPRGVLEAWRGSSRILLRPRCPRDRPPRRGRGGPVQGRGHQPPFRPGRR